MEFSGENTEENLEIVLCYLKRDLSDSFEVMGRDIECVLIISLHLHHPLTTPPLTAPEKQLLPNEF